MLLSLPVSIVRTVQPLSAGVLHVEPVKPFMHIQRHDPFSGTDVPSLAQGKESLQPATPFEPDDEF